MLAEASGKNSKKKKKKAGPAVTERLTATQLNDKVKARGALLIDVMTGAVLFQRNADQPFAPASTTKLMTALVAYEKTGFRGSVTIIADDTRVEPSHVPLVPGEVIPIKDLACSVLIGSDNDSALALARASGGSYGNFIRLMNERASELGCQKTQFINPNGLPAPGQYTTARDLHKIFKKTISYPVLRQIASTKICYFPSVRSKTISNHNKLLGKYPGMGAAKTGWTHSSRHTYAASVIRNERELHLILLNSPNKWLDARYLLDYGFQNLPGTVRPPSPGPQESSATPTTAPIAVPPAAPRIAPVPTVVIPLPPPSPATPAAY